MFKKKASLSINHLIALIIVLIVVGIVLIAIFSPSLFDWIKNLPEYKYEDKDIVIDYNSVLDDVEVEGACFEKVALLGKDDVKWTWGDTRRVYLYEYGNSPRKRLEWVYMRVGRDSYELETIKGIDIPLGKLEGGRLIIYPEIFENYNTQNRLYNKLRNYVSWSDLKRLDNSHITSDILLFCKIPYEANKIPIEGSVFDKNVFLIYNKNNLICSIEDVLESDFKWLKNYRLNNRDLEFFENNQWEKISFPEEALLSLREKREELIEKKDSLGYPWFTDELKIGFSSQEGLFVNIGGFTRFYPIKSNQDFDYSSEFESAIIKEDLDLINLGNNEEPYYVLSDLTFIFPQGYAIDDKNILYKQTEGVWEKFEPEDYPYIYLDSSGVGEFSKQKEIKQDLLEVCKDG